MQKTFTLARQMKDFLAVFMAKIQSHEDKPLPCKSNYTMIIATQGASNKLNSQAFLR